MKKTLRILRSEQGASLVEYALLTVLVAVPSMVAIDQITTGLSENFEESAAAAADNSNDSTDSGDSGDSGDSTTTTVPAATTTTTTTSTTTSTTTTTVPAATTTTSTTAPPASTTTTAPPVTTTSPPGSGGNPVDPAPSQQSVTVDTDGGWLTFESDDGEISIDSYDLNRHWRGSISYGADGSMVVELWHRHNGSAVTITVWIDADGYLQTSVQ